MQSLLSGFIGALIATLLSVLYHYTSEQWRLRSEVMLEVAGYFDDIYTRLQMLFVDKGASYTGRKRGLTDEEYRITSRSLKDFLMTSRVGVRLALVYGEGDITGIFNYLKDSCLEAARILWSATEQDWEEKDTQIMTLFSQRIDPARKNLERTLLEDTRVHRIVWSFIKRCGTGRVGK
jgi:hypothetical protein